MSSPFDFENLNKLLGSFTSQMGQIREDAATVQAEGKAGGGVVTVVANGEFELVSVRIKPEAVEDLELLEDLVVAASNEALRRVREEMAGKMAGLAGGLPLPPGLL